MNIKKIIAGVLVCCAVGGTIPSAANNVPCAVTANADYTEGKYEQLTYHNYGDYISIAGCYRYATEVEIPAEIDGVPVTVIRSEAFKLCENLTSVTIPDSITKIGTYAFCRCSALKSIKIPDSITTIEKGTFSNCSKLSSIEIPENITSIDTTAFEYCSDLKSVTILNPDCKIHDFASTFSNSVQNTFVNPPAGSIPKINYKFDGTIYGYENSTAQAYAEKYDRKFVALVKNADYSLGTYGSLGYKNYGDHIEITNCDKEVTEVEIPAEIDGIPVTIIGSEAFQFCENMTSVIIPDRVTTIDPRAFEDCISLTSINIPDSVTIIGSEAFFGCTKLETIEIPDSVKTILGWSFDDTLWLEERRKENPLVVVNNILVDGKTCSGNVVVPENVVCIGQGAFYNCDLTSIKILNPECEIYDSVYTITSDRDENNDYRAYSTIYGYANSTAQEYAEKYGFEFEVISEAPETLSEIIGDANCDGAVDLADAVSIIQHIGNEAKYGLSEQDIINADCNGDGKITGADAVAIQKLEAGLIDKLPE